jgi:alpha-mannosidase
MKSKTLLILILCFISVHFSNADNLLKKLSGLTAGQQHWLEGFLQNTGGNEFSYHSFRNDVTKSLITRATDGKMDISWETEAVPGDFKGRNAGFVWMAALDLTPQEVIFDVFINGEKRFEIAASEKQSWQIDSGDGGVLSFLALETDQHGDAHGYMTLVAPESWLKKGTAQNIRITGRAHNENTWIIIYQATDALSFHLNSLEYNAWMEMELEKKGNLFNASIKAPFTLAGKKLEYTSGRTKGSVVLTEKDGYAWGEFQLPASGENRTFTLNDPMGEIFMVEALGLEFNTSRLLSRTVLLNECKVEDNKILLSSTRNYQPKTVSLLLELSGSLLSRGEILLMNSSHQDIAWMDSPEQCIIERDTMLITPTLEMAGKDLNYRFDFEHALMLKEYIHRHPESKELIRQMLSDGRISCGATYIQPYEEMYSGEALARQFYFGSKWLRDEFGYEAKLYWNLDVPGRTLQMPQLMKRAGVDYLMISRQEKGLYNWFSPDGSSVAAWSPGHYADAFTALQRNFFEVAQLLAGSSLEWEKFYGPHSTKPVIPLLSSWDMSPPKDYSHHIAQWHNIKELQNAAGKNVPAPLPSIRVASAPEFFDAMMANGATLKNIHGERPNIWLYIHGPSHQKAIKASREGDILLTMAEKFATANALSEGSFLNYPEQQLRTAWEAKIYPDHGWGGKNGDITDAIFWQKYEFAKAEAEKVLDKSLNDLASKVLTVKDKGRPLVVFNSMHTHRTDPVAVSARFEKSRWFGVQLTDANGNPVEVQLTSPEKNGDGSLKAATLNFTAANIPSVGYATYYLNPVEKPDAKKNDGFSGKAENSYYRITFGKGGVTSVYDKELGKELVRTDKFSAGEVFTMRSEGNGAGEFADVQKPDMRGFDRTGNYDTRWTVETSGPVYTCYTYRQPIRGAVVEQRIKLYHQQKMIKFETSLLNWEGELYREYRMALPLNMNDGQVAYEVPFGVVRVGIDEMEGAAGERYTTICREIHPRGIENWISASGKDFGVTMSSSVAVADWIDPTDHPADYPILQPILLASRHSCHWEGNPYLQAGDHHFSFSVSSHEPGWINAVNFGRQANEILKAVWADKKFDAADLPETLSFFGTGNPYVLISTVKKAEDSDGVVFRLVEMEGVDRTVNLNMFTGTEKAYRTSLTEKILDPLPVRNFQPAIKLGHHAIETILVK